MVTISATSIRARNLIVRRCGCPQCPALALDVRPLQDRNGFSSVAEWTARASAGHWGHPHRRTIRFRAVMEVADIDGAWKLVGLTVIDARQQG